MILPSGPRIIIDYPVLPPMTERGADSLFYNGTIYTMDDAKKVVTAVAVSDGRIVAVGNDSEAGRSSPRGCERIDLRGRTVLPGFIDCHTHFIQTGVDSMGVDLSRTRSLREALTLIKEAGSKYPPGEWVIATNWKESGWPGGRFITKQDLDSCCPDNPAVAHRVCGHLSTVNSRAIEILCIDSKTPDVDLGKGILRENALQLPRKQTEPDDARKSKALTIATRMAHELGVTSINDNGQSADIKIYLEAEKRGRLGVRVWFNTPSCDLDSRVRLGISTGFGSGRLKFGGLKIFCDGALGARTAALSEAYSDDPGNKGGLVIGRSELEGTITRANEAGIQVAIHAIGDAGIGEVISAFSRTLRRTPFKGLRNRIEHLELPSPSHLREMRRMGLIASMQPNFIGEWGGTDGMYLSRLGPKRTAKNNPFRDVLKAKVKLVFGSDCMPLSPIYGIHSAVNAPHASQKISVSAAIAAYTRGAAFASFEESSKGSISVGKMADLIVFSRDPYESAERIGSIRVLKTVVGGEVTYDRIGKKR
jgi:predicted amidohydrolase YtcJ